MSGQHRSAALTRGPRLGGAINHPAPPSSVDGMAAYVGSRPAWARIRMPALSRPGFRHGGPRPSPRAVGRRGRPPLGPVEGAGRGISVPSASCITGRAPSLSRLADRRAPAEPPRGVPDMPGNRMVLESQVRGNANAMTVFLTPAHQVRDRGLQHRTSRAVPALFARAGLQRQHRDEDRGTRRARHAAGTRTCAGRRPGFSVAVERLLAVRACGARRVFRRRACPERSRRGDHRV